MNPKARSILIISSLIVIGIIIGFIIASVSSPYLINQIENPPNHFFPKNGDFNGTKQLERFNLTTDQTNQIIRGYTTSVIILSVELVLLIGLIAIYTNIYSKTKSKYLIGFLLFVGIFLVKSISQLVAMTPLFRDVIREAPTAINPLFRSNFGPFGIFFTIFEIIAICILIYISSE
jgi:hypothetical protein